MTIASLIDGVIEREGGYVDHPDDLGGPTKYGITEETARRNGYTGRMQDLPRSKAVSIYMDEYVNRPGFYRIARHSEKVAEELIDTGINMGTTYPRLWLQQWLNALNKQGTLYPDILEDGKIGPATEAAFVAFRKARGSGADSVMLKGLNGSQTQRYLELSRTRGANESFTYGWLANRVGF